MNSGTIYLRVKIKSLAEEARIIKAEERKAKRRGYRGTLDELHLHRTINVRQEARAAQLAYGFLRGKNYRDIERSNQTRAPWVRTEQLVKKYGDTKNNYNESQRFLEFKKSADAVLAQ